MSDTSEPSHLIESSFSAHPRSSTPGSIQNLKSLLRQTLRITIDDHRIFLGTFVGTDKQLNILLVNTEEFRIGSDYIDGDPHGRYVGQIMVPWRLVNKVEVSEGAGPVSGIREDDDDESMYA
ncbi:hypothetical protein AcV7_000152 [Taiwanofungus camphoratus]|nr:hypothetical protein AcV7_000152 [Antrodia cinnamomea]